MEITMSETTFTPPTAKAIAKVALRGTLFPLVRHEGKVCLPLQAVAHYMRLSIDTMAVIAQCQRAFNVVTLNIVEPSILGFLGVPRERTTTAKVMPLDHIGLLLTVLALVPTYEQDARSLARSVKQLIAEVANGDAPASAAPVHAGIDMGKGVDKTVLTLSVEIEGKDIPSNQVIGDAVTAALVSALGGAMVSATAATGPSPTKH
jgi:hypothetical protein